MKGKRFPPGKKSRIPPWKGERERDRETQTLIETERDRALWVCRAQKSFALSPAGPLG